MKRPSTSAEPHEGFRTGKFMEAAVARKVVANARPRTSSAYPPRPRSNRAA